MYRIEILPSAARDLERLPLGLRRRVARAVDRLVGDPRPRGVTKLRGADDVWRMRVGDLRVLYRVEDDRLLVLIVKVGNRRDVYR